MGGCESYLYKEKRLNTELKLREAFRRYRKMADKDVSRHRQSPSLKPELVFFKNVSDLIFENKKNYNVYCIKVSVI